MPVAVAPTTPVALPHMRACINPNNTHTLHNAHSTPSLHCAAPYAQYLNMPFTALFTSQAMQCVWRFHWWRRPSGRAFELAVCELRRWVITYIHGP